jgi:Secretion system C-terminal sorting domain
LQDYIIGAGNLKNYQWIAADANADGKINIADLTLVKKWMVQGAPEANPKGWHIFHGRDSIHHLTEIQSLTSQVDILNSQGQLDFTAVSRGDVSNANGDEDANSQIVSSADIVMENDHWTMEWNSDHVAGYHLVFKANEDQTVPQFFIDDRQLTNSEVIFDASTKKYHIVRIAEDASLSKLVIKNAKGLSFEPQNSLTIDSENVAHSISTDQRITSAVADVPSIFPNPLMGNEFTLSQDVDRVAVYDSQGRPILLKRTNFQCQIDATPGIYYVHLSKDQNVTVQKLIIIR